MKLIIVLVVVVLLVLWCISIYNNLVKLRNNRENAFANIFQNKYPKAKARELSKEYVALIQGSIMMMNLYDSSEEYLKVGEKIISLI